MISSYTIRTELGISSLANSQKRSLCSFMLQQIFVLVLSIVTLSFFLVNLRLCVNLNMWQFLMLSVWVNLEGVFIFVILIIVLSSVIVFSFYYITTDYSFYYYLFLLIIFVMSMVMLVLRDSIIILMFGWDLLGISRFFLVLYYNNWESCSGAINTVLTNRFGDFMLFMILSINSFSLFILMPLYWMKLIPIIFIIFTSFSKSAQYPLGSWLPKAISAPTPVRALVHSSTLVTGGLVLLFNFSFLLINRTVITTLLIFGLLTMTSSSIRALFEEDIKDRCS